MKKDFWPHFFLASAAVFIALDAISIEAIFFEDEGLFLPWAYAFVGLAFLFWYSYKLPERYKASIQNVVRITFPFTFAVLLIPGMQHFELFLFFAVQAAVYLGMKRHSGDSSSLHKAYKAAATVIIAAGIILCARDAYLTPTISVDESHSSNAAYGILSRGFPYFPNTEVIYSRSWVDLYSIALSYKLFGFSEFSARLPSVIAYTFSIIFMYLILRRTVLPMMGVAALALVALNPWILHYGSYARMYIFLLLFSTFFAYLLLRYLRTRDPRVLYVFLPLALVGGMFSERSFLMFAPPYLLLVLWSLPRTKKFWKKALTHAVLPLAVIAGALLITQFSMISAFVSRYVIGFGGGGSLFEYARIAFTPVEWLSYFGVPLVLLVISTVSIIMRGDAKDRVILALFWFGELLVDVLVYSNFPSKRFNYSFIIVSLYALVIAFGLTILFRYIPRWAKYALTAFIVIYCGYHYIFTYSFPNYAEFSKIRNIPEGSLVLGYPTSPLVFYNIKYSRGNDIRPFITDTIEMEKYVEEGPNGVTEIYSGGVPVMGVAPLNELRLTQDVYLFYEKTRFSFLNSRTEMYILENCLPIDEQVAADVSFHIANGYEFSDADGETRNTLIALKCPLL